MRKTMLTLLAGAFLIAAVGVGLRMTVVPDPVVPNASGASANYDAIVAGGGALPAANQVSIEQDLAMAARLFGADELYFAGGRDARAVQVLAAADRETEVDRLRRDLGFIFAPGAGRGTTYRKTTLEDVHGPASKSTILDAVTRFTRVDSDDALLVYFAGHGDIGATAAENILSTWGNETIDVRELATSLDASRRPVVTVFTTCFSGGFQELIFEGANVDAGVTELDRCGLFASTWDQEAGGCDPNPVRGEQDGFGVHFLHGLAGESPSGAPVPLSELDISRDGRVSLLEAHAYARTASKSIDVPTTTSEAYLRVVETEMGAPRKGLVPEDEKVVAVLEERLETRGYDAAKKRLAELDAELETRMATEADRVGDEDAAYRAVSAALLARWPVLNDPWHPEFDELLAAESQAIRAFLDTSEAHRRFLEATRATREAADARAELQVVRAPWQRLVRAHETLGLAASLHARGGNGWARFQQFRACEGLVP